MLHFEIMDRILASPQKFTISSFDAYFLENVISVVFRVHKGIETLVQVDARYQTEKVTLFFFLIRNLDILVAIFHIWFYLIEARRIVTSCFMQ